MAICIKTITPLSLFLKENERFIAAKYHPLSLDRNGAGISTKKTGTLYGCVPVCFQREK
ncbi:hypothetical protein [Parabacteroides sp. PF5-9]|uniref:hypothetical protein n=1 Tax=Parabacteroides sp. PF5-9 TaxID=1742404 RepID=UPI002473FD3B|nr:hypothetical protein [Parabacteroides sp. PF5-9]MDH6357285.1 hypothetical protein [Parabacteroides sp. PF5-9]